MHLACCQWDIVWEDKPANYRRVAALVAGAALPPGTLLLLPEMFATGFTMNAAAVAEPVDGPTARFLADLAQRHALFVQGGVVIAGADGARPQNRALVFNPDGRLAASYAKVHLFSLGGEPEHYAPGAAPIVFAWGAAAVVPAICYDLRFPELFRAATGGAAEIVAVSACWPAAREEHWLALLRARAIENQCYVAGVNRCGGEPSGVAYSGCSQIIDPRGAVVADAGQAEGVIQAGVDRAAQLRYRQEFPALRDARLGDR